MDVPSSLITNTNRALPQALKQHPQQLRVLQPPQKQRPLLLIVPHRPLAQLEQHPLQLRVIQLLQLKQRLLQLRVPQQPRAQLEQHPLQLRLLQLPRAQLEQRPLQLRVLQLPRPQVKLRYVTSSCSQVNFLFVCNMWYVHPICLFSLDGNDLLL